MATVSEHLEILDRQFEAAVTKGADLSTLPILDWQTFAKGYAQRNVTRTDARRMRSLVGEKVLSSVWALNWDLPHLIKWSYTLFSYDQLQKNLSLLSLLTRLEAEGLLYLAAQEALRAEASKSTDNPVQANARKYYDDWDCYYDSGVRKPCEWDIREVNCISQNLSDLITYLTLFGTEAETGTDPHNYAQVCADALAEVQAFQIYFPTFCAVLNEANLLNLTEKVIVKEPVELQITLPGTETAPAEMSTERVALRPLARAQANKSVADFQGYIVGIVLEPRTEDDRDLHRNFMSAEEIEKAYHHWALNHFKIRVNHDASTEAGALEHEGFRLVMTWIEQGSPIIGGYQVKPGTWMQAYQATTPETIAAVQNYEINGFSPGGDATFWRDPKPSEE